MITRFLRCSNIIFNAQKRSKSVKSFSFLRPRIKEMVKGDKIPWQAGRPRTEFQFGSSNTAYLYTKHIMKCFKQYVKDKFFT